MSEEYKNHLSAEETKRLMEDPELCRGPGDRRGCLVVVGGAIIGWAVIAALITKGCQEVTKMTSQPAKVLKADRVVKKDNQFVR